MLYILAKNFFYKSMYIKFFDCSCPALIVIELIIVVKFYKFSNKQKTNKHFHLKKVATKKLLKYKGDGIASL